MTTAAGLVTDTYTYDAFGVTLTATGTTQNVYLYTGEQLDPNVGFYYLRARYYNQANGRFVTTDPEDGNIFDPVSLHRYLYANANPVDNRDPTGRASLAEALSVVSIIGTLAFIGSLVAAYYGYETASAVLGAISLFSIIIELATVGVVALGVGAAALTFKVAPVFFERQIAQLMLNILKREGIRDGSLALREYLFAIGQLPGGISFLQRMLRSTFVLQGVGRIAVRSEAELELQVSIRLALLAPGGPFGFLYYLL